jgi:arylsulfatase A-like enzyme
VLIFIDTLRADRLGCYGYPKGTSPNIDKLAGESTVFEKNFTPATYTLPSFMSIITSLYPNSHGVLMVCKDKLSPRVTTLAQVFKAYGYKTAWFGPMDDPHLDPAVGFGRGFDDIEDAGDQNFLEQQRSNILDWLDKNRGRKFFLNFHTYKVHSPYMPSLKYKSKFTRIKEMKGVVEDIDEFSTGCVRKLFKDKELAVKLMGEDLFDEFVAAGLLSGTNQQIEDFFALRNERLKLPELRNYVYWTEIDYKDKATNAYVQALYDAEILEYDQEVIGPVIAKLKELNLYNKTMIIVCADHGEEFYEHGGYGHGSTFYDEVTYVPLIIRVPWLKQGRKIKEFTQTVDIMPTILDLLDIPIPHQAQGKSLAGFIRGRHPLPPHECVFGSLPDISYLRSEKWLFVSGNDEPDYRKLYNLVSDPQEQDNIYFKDRETASYLESQLGAWKESLPYYQDQEYSFYPGIDKATQERIRKTGYW